MKMKKKHKQENRDREGHPANVQDYSTNNKAIFFFCSKAVLAVSCQTTLH